MGTSTTKGPGAKGLRALIGVLAFAATASADINLELRPANAQTSLNCPVINFGLFVVSDDDTNQPLSAVQVVVTWDPNDLEFLGLRGAGGPSLLSSGFPLGPAFPLNESDPPQDGDGFYVAFAALGNPVQATPAGTLLTTFQFEPLQLAAASPVDLPLMLNGEETVVFSGEIPNLDVLGTTSGAVLLISETPIPDLNGDQVVNASDLAQLLGAWGPCPGPPANCPADLNCDNQVNAADLAALLGAWGPV